MRIHSPMKLAGYFWLPALPDRQVPGTLSIADGGDIEIEVIADLDPDIKQSFNLLRFTLLHGYVEALGAITIEDCFYRQRNVTFSRAITRSRLRGSRVLAGYQFQECESMAFNSLTFAVEGLDEWLNTAGFQITIQDDFRSGSIDYKPPEIDAISLPGGFTLSFVVSVRLPQIPAIKQACIGQSVSLCLSHQEARPIEDFTVIAYRLTLLLGFAMDQTVAMHSLVLRADALQEAIAKDVKRPLAIRLFYESKPFAEAPPKLDRHEFLFGFRDVQGQLTELLAQWLSGYDAIYPALGLYFSIRNDDHPYLAGQFLSLVQGLETYSRQTMQATRYPQEVFDDLCRELLAHCDTAYRGWLEERLRHGNEPSLRQRLKALIKPFSALLGSASQRSTWVNLVVDTRNYLTHYDDTLRSRAAEGEDLYWLTQATEAVFQLHILSLLGFAGEDIEQVVGRCYRLRAKLTRGEG